MSHSLNCVRYSSQCNIDIIVRLTYGLPKFVYIIYRNKVKVFPLMRGYHVDVGVVPIAVKDAGKVIRKQLEVDFVCNLGSGRYYIQSAYSIPDEQKRAQETRPFTKIDDSFKKIIITRDIVPAQYDERGILTINIYDFLLDATALER